MKQDKIALLQAQKKLEIAEAKLSKVTTLLTDSYTKANPIDKEELAKVYDPENPQATQQVIDQHNATVKGKLDKQLEDLDKEIGDKLNVGDDELGLLADVSTWAESNKKEDVSLDKLKEELPPRLYKAIAEAKTTDDRTKALDGASTYLDMVGGDQTPPVEPYNATPPKQGGGSEVPAGGANQSDNTDNENDIF